MKSHREKVTHSQESKAEIISTPWSDRMTNDQPDSENKKITNSILSKPKWPSYNTCRRTPSISSSSSISSNSSTYAYSPSSTPSTPFHSISTVGSIPFSWESHPGIPKTNSAPSRNRSRKQLPLPPVFSTNATKLIPPSPSRRDPFFAALVECSKGGGGGDSDGGACDNSKRKGWRVRYLSNVSCKNASAVVESLVLIPRVPRRIGYDVLKKSSH